MLLKNALDLNKKNIWVDILNSLWIKIKNNFEKEAYYKKKIENLHRWKYFISDLDWTFYRGHLIQEAFTLFAKYLTEQDIRNLDLDKYKFFLDDYNFFKFLEKDAYNKKIDWNNYIDAWIFLLYKYKTLIDWNKFIFYLKEKFYIDEKVNPLRFSIKKMKEVLISWNNFLFISWASSFVFEIYLWLLKEYIWKEIWNQYIKNIFWISSYVNFNKTYIYNLWQKDWKFKLLSQIKEIWIFEDIIWGMWDTESDYWISYHLDNTKEFFFINPTSNVISWHNKLKKEGLNYKFIFERKDLIFSCDIEKINII